MEQATPRTLGSGARKRRRPEVGNDARDRRAQEFRGRGSRPTPVRWWASPANSPKGKLGSSPRDMWLCIALTIAYHDRVLFCNPRVTSGSGAELAKAGGRPNPYTASSAIPHRGSKRCYPDSSTSFAVECQPHPRSCQAGNPCLGRRKCAGLVGALPTASDFWPVSIGILNAA